MRYAELDESTLGNEKEPWFYWFLEGVAKILVALGVICGGVILVAGSGNKSENVVVASIVFGLVVAIYSIASYAWILLFIDAARTLRKLQSQRHGLSNSTPAPRAGRRLKSRPED